jgi:hypothetical protein
MILKVKPAHGLSLIFGHFCRSVNDIGSTGCSQLCLALEHLTNLHKLGIS